MRCFTASLPRKQGLGCTNSIDCAVNLFVHVIELEFTCCNNLFAISLSFQPTQICISISHFSPKEKTGSSLLPICRGDAGTNQAGRSLRPSYHIYLELSFKRYPVLLYRITVSRRNKAM